MIFRIKCWQSDLHQFKPSMMLSLLHQFISKIKLVYIIFTKRILIVVPYTGPSSRTKIMSFLRFTHKRALIIKPYFFFIYHCIAILHIVSRTWYFILYQNQFTFQLLKLILKRSYLFIIPKGLFLLAIYDVEIIEILERLQDPGPGRILDAKGRDLSVLVIFLVQSKLLCISATISLNFQLICDQELTQYDPGPIPQVELYSIIDDLQHLDLNIELRLTFAFLRDLFGLYINQMPSFCLIINESSGLSECYTIDFLFFQSIYWKNVLGALLLNTDKGLAFYLFYIRLMAQSYDPGPTFIQVFYKFENLYPLAHRE